MPDILRFAIGLTLLGAGGDLLVRYASRLALSLGVSTLLVGLTIVSMGTSAPEMVVGVLAAGKGQSDIAIGNTVGSNICNILLILGVSASLVPVAVSRRVLTVDTPVMIVVTLLFVGFSLTSRQFNRMEAAVFLVAVCGYLGWRYRMDRRDPKPLTGAGPIRSRISPVWLRMTCYLVLVAVSMGLLMLGSELTVDAAVSMATKLGISQSLIAVTVVAFGTSLPELTTCIVATLKGKQDIAIGNIIGSNIFNILVVLGVGGMIRPMAVDSALLTGDFPIMVLVALCVYPLAKTGYRVSKAEGAALLAAYLAYVLFAIHRMSSS